MKTYYQITCELYTEHVVPVINAKQYDSGRGVDITLTDCGAVVVPAVSDVCNLYCKKSDGTVSYISGTVNGSAVRVDFTNVLLAEAGVVECELEVTSGADTVSTPVFRMVVLPSNYDQGAIQSQDEFTALEDALAQLSNIKQAAYYDVADNLTTAAAGSYVLDAAQGKVLRDLMETAPFETTGYLSSTDDLDDVKTAGVYYAFGATNLPQSGSFYVLVLSRSDATNRWTQICVPSMVTTYQKHIYMRVFVNSLSAWGEWIDFNADIASHATKTATTGNTGNISLAIKTDNVYVISAWCTSGSNMIVPFTDTSGNWYVKVLNWNGTTYAPVVSTSVTVDYVTIPA